MSPTARVTVITELDPDDGGWIAACRELPGAMSQGDTEAEALDNIADAIAAVIEVELRHELAEAELDELSSPPHRRSVALPA